MAKKLSKMEQMKLTKAKRAGESLQPPQADPAEGIVSIGGQEAGRKAERRMIKTSQIAYNENNDYSQLDRPEDIYSLAENIRQNGLAHNLVVVERQSEAEPDKRFVLLSGERRLRAIRYIQENQDPTFYPEVACYVVPASEFVRPEGVAMSDEEYRRRVEMIKLDTANLQARGGTGDSTQTTKAMNRYKQNVMAVYGISERAANAQLLSLVGEKNKRFFERSQQLYKNLLPELYELYVEKETDLTQQDFLKLTAFDEEEQGKLYEAAKLLHFRKEELEDEYDFYRSALRRLLTRVGKSTPKSKEKLLADCDSLLVQLNRSLTNREGARRMKRAEDTIRVSHPILLSFYQGKDSLFTPEELLVLTDPEFRLEYQSLSSAATVLYENRRKLGEDYPRLVTQLHDLFLKAAAMERRPHLVSKIRDDCDALKQEADEVLNKRKKSNEKQQQALSVSAKEQRIRNRSSKLKRACTSLTEEMTAKDADRFAKQICADKEEAEALLMELDALSRAIVEFRSRLMEAYDDE